MLQQEIENRRQQLIKLVNKYGLTSTKVLQCSKELDRLLAQFQEQQATTSSIHPKKIS